MAGLLSNGAGREAEDRTDAAAESNGSSLTLPRRQEEKPHAVRVSPPSATTKKGQQFADLFSFPLRKD